MSDTGETYTIREAALASGVSSKSIRNWLDDSEVAGAMRLDADADREGGQWRRFTFVDIVKLAMTGALSTYCVPLAYAARVANTTVHYTWRPGRSHEYLWCKCEESFRNFTIRVWKGDAGWTMDLADAEIVDHAYVTFHPHAIAMKIAERLELEETSEA